jgi:hypothetical protein
MECPLQKLNERENMKTRNAVVVLAVVAVGLGLSARVSAQPYVMGHTGGDLNYLDVTIAGGSIIDLNTGQGQINAFGLNQGWWSPTAGNSLGNDNHVTGDVGGALYNSFYVFDTSFLGNVQATGATLVLNDNYGDWGLPPFNLSFWDVTTPVGTLVDTVGTSAAIYNDLGGSVSGIEYGSLAYGGGSTITVTLNKAAIEAINESEGNYFAIGAHLSSSVPDGGMTLGLLGMCATALFGLKRKN